MLDSKTFTHLYSKYSGLARHVCNVHGFSRDEIDDVTQEFWASLWKYRNAWPNPDNVEAYLVSGVKYVAFARMRQSMTLKRGGEHVLLPEEGSRSSVQLFKATELSADRVYDDSKLAQHLKRLAKKIGGRRGEALLRRLEHYRGTTQETSRSRSSFSDAVRVARQKLGIPIENPGSAKVDARSHLAVMMSDMSEVPSKAA